mmetsp:Transcript_30064/g.101356  ORF Transcript_30064/g.101356 Transcript_30064/m.101356 type:complete len:209 (-) Transcript_30064:224-850(-)
MVPFFDDDLAFTRRDGYTLHHEDGASPRLHAPGRGQGRGLLGHGGRRRRARNSALVRRVGRLYAGVPRRLRHLRRPPRALLRVPARQCRNPRRYMRLRRPRRRPGTRRIVHRRPARKHQARRRAHRHRGRRRRAVRVRRCADGGRLPAFAAAGAHRRGGGLLLRRRKPLTTALSKVRRIARRREGTKSIFLRTAAVRPPHVGTHLCEF